MYINPKYTTKDIRRLLIGYLVMYSIPKDMILKICLMIKEDKEYMVKLILWMKEQESVTEDKIIIKILEDTPPPE